MNKIYKKYGFDYNLLWLIVELKFNPVMYYKLKINGLINNYQLYRDLSYFINKQKRGKLHVVLICPRAYIEVYWKLEEWFYKEDIESEDTLSNKI